MDPQRTMPDDVQALQDQLQSLAARIRELEGAIERVDVELSLRPQWVIGLRMFKLNTLSAIITTLTTRLILALSRTADVSSWVVAMLIGNGVTILTAVALALALHSRTNNGRNRVEQLFMTLGVAVPKAKES